MGGWLRPALAVAAAALLTPAFANYGRCDSSSADSCWCMLACPIYGGDNSKCGEEPGHAKAIDDAIQASYNKSDAMCKGMECIVNCAAELGCLDAEITHRCQRVLNADEKCQLKCTAE
ncbi:unnamed protein product, partial [Prorocentrum cordatum]